MYSLFSRIFNQHALTIFIALTIQINVFFKIHTVSQSLIKMQCSLGKWPQDCSFNKIGFLYSFKYLHLFFHSLLNTN